MIAGQVPRVQFMVARAPNLADGLFAPLRHIHEPRIAIVAGRTDAVLAAADVVVTASGTATVQTAIHERPMVIVNLVAGQRIVPELIQDAFTPVAVTAETVRYFADPGYAERTREALREVRARLGTPGASRRAAGHVLAVCDGRSAHVQ
jgi:lipid-A-disaccharide synthase